MGFLGRVGLGGPWAQAGWAEGRRESEALGTPREACQHGANASAAGRAAAAGFMSCRAAGDSPQYMQKAAHPLVVAQPALRRACLLVATLGASQPFLQPAHQERRRRRRGTPVQQGFSHTQEQLLPGGRSLRGQGGLQEEVA